MANNIIINIGRQLGSGGREIGRMLAADFDLKFMDKELVALAAEKSGLCSEFFEKADEKASQAFGGLFSMRFPFISDGCLPTNNCLSNDSLFKVQSDVIRDLASNESCVFIGRCADYVLRDFPQCVNVFISAPLALRASRIAKQLEINEQKAKELIHKTDKKRAEYYNYYSSKTWGMAATYHLCIDSSVLGMAGTEQFIKDFVKKKLGL